MNDQIVARIKKYRIEKGLTQQHLADHLGKTAAAISDLERGKVQVSASDLFKIATLLEKPIQLFYGESLLNEDAEQLLHDAQKIKPSSLKEISLFLKMSWQIGEFIARLDTRTKSGDKLSPEETKEFYDILLPYFATLQDRMDKAVALKRKIDKIIEESPTLDGPST